MKLPRLLIPTLGGALCALVLLSTPAARACGGYGGEPSVTLRVAPERDLVYRGGSREVILEVEITAKKPTEKYRSPVNVSVVLDRSGSMSGAKIEKARQAAGAALDRLEPDDYFSLVIYDNEAQVLIPPARAGSRAHREELKEKIDRIRPGGGTALHAGVQLGAQQVRQFLGQERVNRVILVSDGLANVGPQRTSDLVALGHRLRGESLSVTTIGLGDDFNEDLMTGLAEASHANYYYVKDAEKLPGIFSEELGSAATRVASGLRIRIVVPAGVCVREIVGHPEIRCEEHAAEIALPELFGAEHRLFHLRCHLDDATVESNKSAEPISLASVALTYQDAEKQKPAAQNQSASVRLTGEATKSEASVRDDTARNLAVLGNRLDKEAAVRLADNGQAKEAAALLQKRALANGSLPEAQQIPSVKDENRKLESWATEIAKQGGLGNESRKAAQYENYQDRVQRR